MSKVRLYLDQPLGEGQTLPLTRDQAHYLFGVMRLGVGETVSVFNGRDGEWQADVTDVGKRGGTLVARARSALQQNPPDLWLLFAPIKKARTDFIVEKAAELGAARILPTQTAFTNSERIRRDRLEAHAIEAAEQCGGTFVPEVDELVSLAKRLDTWSGDRRILFCDESKLGEAPIKLDELPRGPWAVLVGPEGGFSDEERTRLRALPFSHAVSLGPRVLRADTAAVAALTLWQNALGDWT